MLRDEIVELERSARRRALWTPGATTTRVELGRDAIERLLPHRDPLLLVDRIDAIDLDQRAISGRRTISPHDPVFAGHFPGHPIYPGVLLLEAMGQLGICLISFAGRGSLELPEQADDVRALRVHDALFLREVGPGAVLDMQATLLSLDGWTALCAGQARVGGEIAAFAVMEVYLVE